MVFILIFKMNSNPNLSKLFHWKQLIHPLLAEKPSLNIYFSAIDLYRSYDFIKNIWATQKLERSQLNKTKVVSLGGKIRYIFISAKKIHTW